MTFEYHPGERSVQDRAGVRSMADRVANGIHSSIPEAAVAFLSERRFLLLGGEDRHGQVWTSVLTGPAGFLRTVTPTELRIDAVLPTDDPLFDPLFSSGADGVALGALAIDPATRRRMRLNGRAFVGRNGITIRAEQVYANCPKYIQKREEAPVSVEGLVTTNPSVTETLTPEQMRRWQATDTFFIATIHPQGGADVSHRGGNPGFVRVDPDGRSLYWPDYAGNAMFNTLGNIEANPAAGLLLIDFDGSGDLLRLTGTASLLWDDEAEHRTGARRGVRFVPKQVVDSPAAFPLRHRFRDYSPFNP
ncbi:MAG: pyridoxamine 5'-phosphate oxidase family protein [Capsulimonadales bacterium]|nr:pyridoxamine 5'-phosphate oxidase family protein [Capsulimonadales bacterium]